MDVDVKTAVVAATAQIQRHWPTPPRVAIILGTGLGQLVQHVSIAASIPFAELPGFPRTTALAHRGRLIGGTLKNVPLLLLDGRCHLYEGYSFADLALPIRVLHACGATTLVVTNASGGLDQRLSVGDVVVIEDHINLMGSACAQGCWDTANIHLPRLRPPIYDVSLRQQAVTFSHRRNFVAHQGVYAAVTGPNYETRAEYKFLRYLGADVVGMSTVPEVLMAHTLGMRILGLSVVTNVARPDSPEVVDARHVVSAAEHAEPHVRQILEQTLLAPQGHESCREKPLPDVLPPHPPLFPKG